MSEADPSSKDAADKRGKPEHEPPAGADIAATWRRPDGSELAYTARAGWTVLRRDDKPAAEIFSVAYVADPDAGAADVGRPLMFVFNGGPGASSAYLHMGALGPQRVAFGADGSLPRLPARLVPNEDSWLAFCDLVFIDPVGTGFSRRIEPDGEDKDKDEYFGYKRDLEALCEFMSRWLSTNRRWGSPLLIAGESYGGYRVGRLVKMAQESAGIGLSGAILISPALEISGLVPTDYDVLAWIDVLPTMALAAVHHGRSRAFGQGTPAAEIHAATEDFATGEYTTLLTRGAAMPAPERERILTRLADIIGLAPELVTRAEGRIDISRFSHELLRDQRRVLGLYDATITASDPFPDREPFAGPDPTLVGATPVYTAAINRQLRAEIGVRTDREYALLSLKVNEAWKNDAPEHFFAPPVGATDDFRYGMSLNPHMQAFIAHGRYDLVTPYYATERLRNLMRLDPAVAERLTVQHYDGGHMFYAWEQSRRAFSAAIARFVADATRPAQ